MESGKLLLGLLAGVAVGAALGILFAPAKGSDTRKKIYDKGEDLTEGLKEKFDLIIASDILEHIGKELTQLHSEPVYHGPRSSYNKPPCRLLL